MAPADPEESAAEAREERYLALYDELAGEASEQVAAALAAAGGWPERVAAVLSALFDLARAKPEAARTCLGEPLVAGPAAVERYEEALDQFGRLLLPGRRLNPRGDELPASLERTLAGGVAWMVVQALDAGADASLDPIQPEALRFLLAPYLGEEEAARLAAQLGAAER